MISMYFFLSLNSILYATYNCLTSAFSDCKRRRLLEVEPQKAITSYITELEGRLRRFCDAAEPFEVVGKRKYYLISLIILTKKNWRNKYTFFHPMLESKNLKTNFSWNALKILSTQKRKKDNLSDRPIYICILFSVLRCGSSASITICNCYNYHSCYN